MQLDLNDKYQVATQGFDFILQEKRKQGNSDLGIVRHIKYKDYYLFNIREYGKRIIKS